MKFPYGISDFYKVITGGYFYADRTAYIRLLEEIGDQFLFLRPRRFGKSLLLSLLENYYDVNKADVFEQLFGGLDIGQNPTPLHNRYLILRWDFSIVATYGDVEDVAQALADHVNSTLTFFSQRYQHLLPVPIELHPTNPVASFQSAMAAVQQSNYKLYLLIDEYDNFANEVLMAGGHVGRQRYQELVESASIFRTLFKAVKSATSGLGLDRIFITGVSPIVLSDVSSGFNIAGNIYLWPNFNEICGFTEAEITTVLQQIAQARQWPAAKVNEALTMMRAFYNGYSFSYELAPILYNPTSALYFLQHLQLFGDYPRQMFDSNLIMDRAKIAYIAHLPHGEPLLMAALQGQPLVSVKKIEDRFGVERMLQADHDTTFMASLLYYFGVLTLSEAMTASGEAILQIPNLLARNLYADRIQQMLLPDVAEREQGQAAAKLLYQQGAMQPLCDFIEQRYFKVFDNRDYKWANELTVKTAFLTLLFDDTFYMMDSEPALQRRYADLLMIIRPEMRKYQLVDVLIEFEYVSLGDAGKSGAEAKAMAMDELKAMPSVNKKLHEARTQLQSYRALLQTQYGALLRLHTYAVVAVGFERLVWEEV